jgi:hypothetical protein
VGELCDKKRKSRYLEKANSYVLNLQKYEKASPKVQLISEGEEGKDFWNIWGF